MSQHLSQTSIIPIQKWALLDILGKLIASRYVAESMTTDAGCFGHIGLCQLHTKLLCIYTADKGLHRRHVRPVAGVYYYSAYLLTSSPNINNIAMSLYDIIVKRDIHPPDT